MLGSFRCFVIVLGIFLLATPSFAQPAAATKALHDLFAREWEYDMQ